MPCAVRSAIRLRQRHCSAAAYFAMTLKWKFTSLIVQTFSVFWHRPVTHPFNFQVAHNPFLPGGFLRSRTVDKQHPLQCWWGNESFISFLWDFYLCCIRSSCSETLPHSAFNGQAKQWGLELLWKLRQAEATQDIMKHVWLSREGKRCLNWVQNIHNSILNAILSAVVSFLSRGYLLFSKYSLFLCYREVI